MSLADLSAQLERIQQAERDELRTMHVEIVKMRAQIADLAIDRATYLQLARHLADELSAFRPVAEEITEMLA